LLRELAKVADNTLAFLYGGADQQPGDYERNQVRAPQIRADFTAYCEQHPFYANWRQAWAAFIAARPPEDPDPVFIPPPAPEPAVPAWRLRYRERHPCPLQ
jgi:hypothetical protein